MLSTGPKPLSVSQDEHFSGPESTKERGNPLLSALLKDNTTKGSINKSSLTVKAIANIDHNPSQFSMRKQQNLDHIEGNNVTCSEVQISSHIFSGPKAAPTNDEILEYIKQRLAPFGDPSNQRSREYDATALNEETQISGDTGGNVLISNIFHVHTTTFSKEDNVQRQGLNIWTEQDTATGGQPPPTDHSPSSKATVPLSPKERRDCSTVASDTHSAGTIRPVKYSERAPHNEAVEESACIEYPQIMRTIAATCTKTQDAGPGSEMTLDKSPEKRASSRLLTCSSAHEGHRSYKDIQKKGNTTQTGVPWTLQSTNNQKQGETAEPVKLDRLKLGTHNSVVSKHNQGLTQPCVHVHQYEDISEDEEPCVHVHQYEDISEDEEPQVETTSPTHVPKNNNGKWTLENEGCEKRIPQTVVSPKSVAPQPSSVVTGKQASYSSSSVLNETEYQMEEDDDDEWLVICVSMEDIDFEPEDPDEEQDDMELIVLHPEESGVAGRWNATRPTQRSVHEPDSDPALPVVPSQIEVFDTFDSFVKAKSEQFGFCKSKPPDALDADTEPYNARDTEPEDSCDTEDSCNYSSVSQRNRLTVDMDLLSDVHEHKEVLDARNGSRQKARNSNDIIVIDSDTDDEDDQTRSTSLFPGSKVSEDSPCHGSSLPSETNPGFEQVKHYTNGLDDSAEIINLDSDTNSSESVTDQLTDDKEPIQQKTKKRDRGLDKASKRYRVKKKKSTVKRSASSAPAGGSSTTSHAVQNKLVTRVVNHRADRERPTSATSARLHPSAGKPVIGRMFVAQSSKSGSCLKLSQEPKDKQKTHTKSNLSSTDNSHKANKPPASVAKPEAASRQRSRSNQEGPAPPISSSTPTVGQVRQRSASVTTSGVPKPSTSVPTQRSSSSKLKRSHSYSNTTLEHSKAPAKDGSTTAQSFTKKRLRSEWHESFVPTKFDRKPETEKPSRTTSCDSSRQERPGPSHRRKPRSKHRRKSTTALMKRTMEEARQWTKDKNPTMSSGPSNIVGKHYKWAEAQRPTKGSDRKKP